MVPAKDRNDHNLVVRKKPFPLRLVSSGDPEIPETQISGFVDSQNSRDSGFEALPSIASVSISIPEANAEQLSDEELQRQALVADILEVTSDHHSRRFYARVSQELSENVIRRFISEIKADEAGNFRGTRGQLFTIKVRDWYLEQGRAPFWKPAPGAE